MHKLLNRKKEKKISFQKKSQRKVSHSKRRNRKESRRSYTKNQMKEVLISSREKIYLAKMKIKSLN
jgi:hypothetical protein